MTVSPFAARVAGKAAAPSAPPSSDDPDVVDRTLLDLVNMLNRGQPFPASLTIDGEAFTPQNFLVTHKRRTGTAHASLEPHFGHLDRGVMCETLLTRAAEAMLLDAPPAPRAAAPKSMFSERRTEPTRHVTAQSYERDQMRAAIEAKRADGVPEIGGSPFTIVDRLARRYERDLPWPHTVFEHYRGLDEALGDVVWQRREVDTAAFLDGLMLDRSPCPPVGSVPYQAEGMVGPALGGFAVALLDAARRRGCL